MSFFSPHELVQLLHSYGPIVLAIVVGLECVGLPLPGETLLVAAAVYTGTSQKINIALVILFAAAGAIIGQAAAYGIGWSIGYRLLRRYGRYVGLTPRRLAFGRVLFRRHGVKVVIIARFVVVLRTIAGLLAGANHMPWPRFIVANIVGGIAWTTAYGLAAYELGHVAKDLAGPVAIGLGVLIIVALAGAALFARRHEHRLLASPPRRTQSAEG